MSDFYTPRNGFPSPVQFQSYQFCLESWRIYCWIDPSHQQTEEDQRWKYLAEWGRPGRRQSWRWRRRGNYRGRWAEIHKSLCWRSRAGPGLETMMMMRGLEWLCWKQFNMKNMFNIIWLWIIKNVFGFL